MPEHEREQLVADIEARLCEVYADDAGAADATIQNDTTGDAHDEQHLHVTDAPIQRKGYVEQVIRTYTPTPPHKAHHDDPPNKKDAG